MESSGTLVIKVGGKEVEEGPFLERFSEWVADAVHAARRVVVVHGGGEEISRRMAALGLTVVKVDGRRVTSPEALPIVIGVLAGEINLRIVSNLRGHGVVPIGLTGASADLLQAKLAEDGRLGRVGEPSVVDASLLWGLLYNGLTPVVAPIAPGEDGKLLNVNADSFAGALASTLGADLLFVTDVAGILGTDGVALPEVTPLTAAELLRAGVIREGMVPKVSAALGALRSGARRAWIGPLTPLLRDHALPPGGTSVVLSSAERHYHFTPLAPLEGTG